MSGAGFGLAHPAQLAQEIHKSRFIAQATPVTAPQQALEYLAQVADPTATHNCWAYRIGQQYRFSDDGEPAGTAGKPILRAIDGQRVDRVVLVVTRWFGGIKLGAGGLMRAYGGVAAQCLRRADKIALVDTCAIEVTLGFAALPLLHARMHALDAKTLNEAFAADGATLRVTLPAQHLDALRAIVADVSRGQATLRVLESK